MARVLERDAMDRPTLHSCLLFGIVARWFVSFAMLSYFARCCRVNLTAATVDMRCSNVWDQSCLSWNVFVTAFCVHALLKDGFSVHFTLHVILR